MANVNQAFLAGRNFNKRAKRQDTSHNAFIDRAGLWIVCNRLHHKQSAFGIVDFNCGDKDAAILFHINFAVAFRTDLLDHLALLADHFADLLHRHLGGKHLRCIFGELRARLRDAFEHDFI